ncbi:MAG: integrase [Haliea sp.]|nr:integrase [Haliea sp.]|tara:strand:+ start:143 stop:1162 length:1020 start_codon:yes stop_codon:yes gene_type:complete
MSPKPRKKENSGLPKNWRFKHGAYYYRVPPGERHRWDGKSDFRLGATLSEAHITYGKRQEFAGALQSMAQVCDRYALEVVPFKAPATQRSNQYSLRRIRYAFGDNPVQAIKPVHIYQYRDHIGRTESKKKANLDLEVLSHLFTKAIEWGAREGHPMTGRQVVKFPMKARDRYVTDAELIAFAATLPVKWQLLVSLAVWTGRRKSELLNLTRADLTEEGIAFSNSKRKGDRFTVAWTDELRGIVEAILSLQSKVSAMHLFHTRMGQPYIKPDGTASGFDAIWQRYMKKWETAGNERFTLHDLRAKRASDLTLEQAQELLRHTTAGMTQRTYRRKGDVVKL